MSVRILQLSNPYDTIPTHSYGGIGRVATLLHQTLHPVATIAAPDSTGANIYAATQRTPEALLRTASHITEEFDCVLAHHPDVAQLAAHIYGPDRVAEVIHMPIQGELLDHYRQAPHRLIGISAAQLHDLWFYRQDPAVIWHATPAVEPGPGHGKYLVWVGRWTAGKGALDAIAAARQAGLPLTLIGAATNAQEQQWYEAAVEPLLNDTITVIHNATSTQRDTIVGQASATVIPTRAHEPFGLTVIESAMLGTPVLGYPTSATYELLRTGIGRICGTVDELALAARAAVDGHFDRAQIRAHAIQHFSPEVQADQYRSLLSRWFTEDQAN